MDKIASQGDGSRRCGAGGKGLYIINPYQFGIKINCFDTCFLNDVIDFSFFDSERFFFRFRVWFDSTWLWNQSSFIKSQNKLFLRWLLGRTTSSLLFSYATFARGWMRREREKRRNNYGSKSCLRHRAHGGIKIWKIWQQRGERHLSLVLWAHTEKCCHSNDDMSW